ncbi:hypothetical protein A3860_13545 [Niastella vici]|uniref:Lipoprotein n=1 Tax=Niastella vici TaxID=1703345 RepID=A0A1V9G7I4_9BACT|nr:hypothetical protein [Niastella vici]OQP66504.1 hypothetical protein A3860_13545 [Niastella vici]
MTNTFHATLLATLAFIISIALSACAQTKALDQGKPGKAFVADTSVIAIFNDRSKINFSSEELSLVDSILQQCINDYDLMNISAYKRQYVPAINDKGEKVVWVNCFCGTSRNWKKDLIVVNDGGSCYFNVTINLTSHKYENLIVNGVA